MNGHLESVEAQADSSFVPFRFAGNSDTVEKILPILSRAILRSAWVEPDVTVHAVMWQPVLTFLKGVYYMNCYFVAWLHDGSNRCEI